jgi:sugar lactone lactonase YvrE
MFILAASAGAQTYTINTVAGTGTAGYSGDGGPATSAQLCTPAGVAVDSSGNLYIGDTGNHRVRKVAVGGTISTVAGTGTASYSGDGSPAASAQLNYPTGVAVDSSGNLYIADEFNHRIRKVTPGGTISTVAGTGTAGYSGDGSPATSAQLNYPYGVAVDSNGNLYIADDGNHRIREVASGGTISTVAGTGTAGYSGDGGQATSAKLYSPTGVAVDSSGNLYIADHQNNRVRKVATDGTISTVAGTGTAGYSGDGGSATSAQLDYPTGVAVDSSGNLYVGDFYNNRVRKVTAGGTISTVAGTGTAGYSGDGGPAASAQLNAPSSVAVDAAGRIYVADSTSRIRILTSGSVSSCWYAVSTNDLGVPASGGQVKLTLHTAVGCAWSLSGLPSWLTVSGSSSGAASAEITLLADSNTGAARTGTLSLGGVSAPIRQTDSSACGGSDSCVIRALPHLAFGNEWTTGLFAMNSDTQARRFTVAFYGDDGSSLALPFGGDLGNSSALSDSVPAQGAYYYEAANTGWPTTGGWGLVTADASITLHGVFRRAPAEGNFYEAGVAAGGGYSGFLVPFDATTFAPANAPFYTGFAISSLNPSAAAYITCVARDHSGTVIPHAVSVPALNPLGHWGNYLFPALAGKRGTLDCSADTLVSAIVFRFIGTAAFSSLPVIVK